jgi:hypothetical protein
MKMPADVRLVQCFLVCTTVAFNAEATCLDEKISDDGFLFFIVSNEAAAEVHATWSNLCCSSRLSGREGILVEC